MSRILNPLPNGVNPCDIPSLNGTGLLCGKGCLLSKNWIQFLVQEFLIFCCAVPSEWYRNDIGIPFD